MLCCVPSAAWPWRSCTAMRPCLRPLMRYSAWCASASWNRLGRCDTAVTFLPIHLLVLNNTSRLTVTSALASAGVAPVAAPGTESGVVEAAADTLPARHMPLGGECSHTAARPSTFRVFACSTGAGRATLWLLTWTMRRSGTPGDPPRLCAVGRQGRQDKGREGRYGWR